MNSNKLSERLLAAAAFVRQGSVIADVGSDHAYLPIYLCNLGKIRRAVASDINEGPVARAMINVGGAGLSKKITVLRAAGLCGIEKYSPDDIVICGMGGELIRDIIADATWTKNRKIRLILQPMTHAEKLRAFLLEEGYTIIGESLVKEDKIYQIISAEYTGESEAYSPVELIFGRKNIIADTPVFRADAAYVKGVYETRRRGKLLSGGNAEEEESLLLEIDRILKG